MCTIQRWGQLRRHETSDLDPTLVDLNTDWDLDPTQVDLKTGRDSDPTLADLNKDWDLEPTLVDLNTDRDLDPTWFTDAIKSHLTSHLSVSHFP